MSNLENILSAKTGTLIGLKPASRALALGAADVAVGSIALISSCPRCDRLCSKNGDKADIAGLRICAMCGRLRVGKSFLHVCSIGRCSHVFGLLDAVHMTAGHNALRGSGPGQNLAFDNAVAHVGCPDRRIDRLCITCCSLSNLHITPGARRDLVYAASATGCLYRSPLAIMAQAIRASLLASAMAATLVGRRANSAVSQGRCLVPWILA